MKIFRLAAALAFLLACAPAFAQQTAIHSVPIGKGVGNTGFNAAVPGTAGKPLVSQGTSADPAFGNIANSGFAAGAADTYKGSLNGTSVVDVPRAPCTSVSQALRYTAGVGESCGNVIVQTGYDMPVNFGLSVPAPSGGALVINLTQANGSAPSSTNPVLVPFRSTALATGTVTWATISAPQSITIPSGATLVPARVWIFEDYNGGTPELGVATCSNSTTIFPCAAWESTLVTSVTIGGSSNTGGVLYTTSGVTADAVRIIGYCDFSSGQSTAGAWANACTTLQPFGPGIKKPGDPTGNVSAPSFGTLAVVSSTGAATATNVTASITLTATPNLVRYSVSTTAGSTTDGGNALAQLYRNTTAIGAVSRASSSAASVASGGSVNLGTGYDAPGLTSLSAITYVVKVSGSGASLPAINTDSATEVLEEIQG
jgi:hypothetical protein